ncbi:hypothetical protein ScalyP_jg6882 [Parmales sp. scaly parma]|nr:hypothetical protein ScalyP_jg6882 [Parmales sp. scaly parma]
MRIENDIKLDFKDVLIRPKRSTLASRSQVSVTRKLMFKHPPPSVCWEGTPICVANMDTTGTWAMASAVSKHKIQTCMHKHYDLEDWSSNLQTIPLSDHMFIAASCGSSEADRAKVASILDAHPTVQMICLDVANGYSETFVNTVRLVREANPNTIIMAGNVVTGEMTEELLLSGADIIKVGIGPGSVCTTRKQTGVGYPQLSAVIECADAAHGLNGHVVSDGGTTCPGDFSKAFGAGADFVMSGGMFAGHTESGGELVTLENGDKVKKFYGMSSATAMNKHAGGVANYRSSEGKTVSVPYRGSVDSTVLDILGGIRSSCTYVGASSIKELSKRTTFIRVSQQLNNVFGTRDEDKQKF